MYKVTKPAEMERDMGNLLAGSAQAWVGPDGPDGPGTALLAAQLATSGIQQQEVRALATCGTRQ